MKIKAIFQDFLIKYGGAWALKYVEKKGLDDTVVNKLINTKKDDFLLHYIKFHTLSASQITMILNRDGIDELMLEVVRINTLSSKQQELLVAKKHVLLFEAYLSPKGYFDERRRFQTLPEYMFIYGILHSEKLICVEVFKTYVDNCFRTLLTPDLIELLIANETSFVTQYIFSKSRVKKEWEKMFVEMASEDLLRSYISKHEFALDATQLQLVNKSFSLAQLYYEKYKLRSQAQQLYHELRKKKLEEKKADTQT